MKDEFHGDITEPIELKGKRNLVFDFRANSKFKSRTGRSINEVLKKAHAALLKTQVEAGPISPDDKEAQGQLHERLAVAYYEAFDDDMVAPLIWAGLIHEDRSLSIDDIEGLCQYAPGDSFEAKKFYLIGKINRAISRAKGIDPDKAEEEAKKKLGITETTTPPTSSQPPSS